MNLRTYAWMMCCLIFLAACSTPEEKSPLEQLEDAYWQNPGKATGQELVSAYETMIDTLPTDEAKLPVAKKAALLYYNLGANEGLQSNFSKIVNDYKALPNSVATAESILDTLLYGITDPKTQRLVPGVARQYMGLANTYARAYPDAPESPEKLYKSAEIARSIGAYQEALSIYSNIETYFPNYEKAPKALFMQAFTYAEDLQNDEQARALYEQFIEKYPNDDFVDDAQILLESLGKSNEEIFQQFENQ